MMANRSSTLKFISPMQKFYEFWFSGKDTRLAKISLSTTTETYPCTAYSGANDPKIYKKHVIRDDVGLDNMIGAMIGINWI